jgi:hypothetical protein
VLSSAAASLADQLGQVCREFGVAPEPGRRQPVNPPPPTSHPDEWLQLKAGAMARSVATSWQLSPVQGRAFSADLQSARKALTDARGKRFPGSLRQAGVEAITRFKERLNLLNEALGQVKAEGAATEQAREQIARQERGDAERVLAPAVSAAGSAIAELPASMQPWNSPKWE